LVAGSYQPNAAKIAVPAHPAAIAGSAVNVQMSCTHTTSVTGAALAGSVAIADVVSRVRSMLSVTATAIPAVAVIAAVTATRLVAVNVTSILRIGNIAEIAIAAIPVVIAPIGSLQFSPVPKPPVLLEKRTVWDRLGSRQ